MLANLLLAEESDGYPDLLKYRHKQNQLRRLRYTEQRALKIRIGAF